MSCQWSCPQWVCRAAMFLQKVVALSLSITFCWNFGLYELFISSGEKWTRKQIILEFARSPCRCRKVTVTLEWKGLRKAWDWEIQSGRTQEIPMLVDLTNVVVCSWVRSWWSVHQIGEMVKMLWLFPFKVQATPSCVLFFYAQELTQPYAIHITHSKLIFRLVNAQTRHKCTVKKMDSIHAVSISCKTVKMDATITHLYATQCQPHYMGLSRWIWRQVRGIN